MKITTWTTTITIHNYTCFFLFETKFDKQDLELKSIYITFDVTYKKYMHKNVR